MPAEPAPDGPVRPDAAAWNRRIRAYSRGRSYWSREALTELRAMQAAFLAAERDEEQLRRGDVIEAA